MPQIKDILNAQQDSTCHNLKGIHNHPTCCNKYILHSTTNIPHTTTKKDPTAEQQESYTA